MKKLFVLLGITAVLVGGALLAAPYLLDVNRHKDRIVALVEQKSGYGLKVNGDMSVRFLPVFSLTLEGAEAFRTPERKEKLAEAAALSVSFDLMNALRGSLKIDHVALDSPGVYIEKYQDGSFNFMPAKASREANQGASPASAGAAAFVLDRLRIENGTLEYREGGKRTRATGIEVDAGYDPHGDANPLSIAVASLSVDGTEERDIKISGKYGYDAGALSFRDLKLSARGQEIEGKGVVMPNASPLRASLELASGRLDAEKLAGAPAKSGKAAAAAKAAASGRIVLPDLSGLQIDAKVTAKELVYGEIVLAPFDVVASVKGGTIAVKTGHAAGFSAGKVKADIKMTPRKEGGVALAAKAEVTGLALSSLPRSLLGSQTLPEGTVNATADVTTEGATAEALTDALKGKATLRLDAARLDVDALLGKGAEGGGKAKPAASEGETAIAFPALIKGLDVDAAIKARELVYGDILLDRPDLEANVRAGVLFLKTAQPVGFAGGKVSLDVSARPGKGGGVALAAKTGAAGLSLASLPPAFLNKDAVPGGGTLNLKADVTAEGATTKALTDSLAGTASLDVAAERIDLEKLTGTKANDGKAGGGAPAREGWSEERFDLPTWKGLNAQASLKAKELAYGDIVLTPADIAASAAGGVVSLKTAQPAGFSGGKIHADVALSPRAGGGASLAAKAQVAGLLMASLPPSLKGNDAMPVNGTLNVDSNVTASGASTKELMKTLGGDVSFRAEKGKMKSNALVKALTTGRAFLSGSQAPVSNEFIVFDSITTNLKGASGTFRTNDLLARTNIADINGAGDVDMADKRLDMRFTAAPTRSKDAATLLSFVPVRVSGSFSDPAVVPDVQSGLKGVLQDPNKLKDAVEGLRKGFGKDVKGVKDLERLWKGEPAPSAPAAPAEDGGAAAPAPEPAPQEDGADALIKQLFR
jgi:uncharacterized protein involved in outer membrane biogenesis